VTNVEDHVSEFKRRVDNDIKKGIIPALDERVLERFLEHFRQVWKEEPASREQIQNQTYCSNQEDPSIVSQLQSPIPDHISSTSRDHQPLPFRTSGALETSVNNHESFEQTSGELDSMGRNEATGAPGSAEASTRVQSMDNLNQAQAQAISDSTYHDQYWSRLGLDAEFSDLLDEFYGYMDIHSEYPTSPQGEEPQIAALETNPLSGQVLFGHDMEDNFWTEFLQAENEMPGAMAAWKDKNSGNRVLRKP